MLSKVRIKVWKYVNENINNKEGESGGYRRRAPHASIGRTANRLRSSTFPIFQVVLKENENAYPRGRKAFVFKNLCFQAKTIGNRFM